MQKNPLRVVGVAELPALPGINLSLKRTKVGAHFTATFPSQRRTSACLGESPKSKTNKLLHSPGISFSFSWEGFDWNLQKYHHVEFGNKEKGGFAQSGPVR